MTHVEENQDPCRLGWKPGISIPCIKVKADRGVGLSVSKTPQLRGFWEQTYTQIYSHDTYHFRYDLFHLTQKSYSFGDSDGQTSYNTIGRRVKVTQEHISVKHLNIRILSYS